MAQFCEPDMLLTVARPGDPDGEADEEAVLRAAAGRRVRAPDGAELVRRHRDLPRLHRLQVSLRLADGGVRRTTTSRL